MIDSVGFESYYNVVPNSVNIKNNENYLGFKDFLTEKAGLGETTLHGCVGDGQSLAFNGISAEVMEQVLKAIISLNNGTKSIWEIVLQLEKKVDINILNEIIAMAFDDSAAENSIAALLVRYWKKKELLGDNISEVNVNASAYPNRDYINNKAVSELEALIRRKEERKSVPTIIRTAN